MNTLPPEIITMIFEEIYNDPLVNQLGVERTSPLPALHVCQKWREIGLGMLGLDQWRHDRNFYFKNALLCPGHWRGMVLRNPDLWLSQRMRPRAGD